MPYFNYETFPLALVKRDKEVLVVDVRCGERVCSIENHKGKLEIVGALES